MMFSIITVSFNSEKTIERTIKSVLAQTYKEYEYIIVDGASKDSTIEIVKKYEPLFEGRLKWSSEQDSGIYNAMNKGIYRASGDIIGIVNSDDWLEEDALEVVYKEAVKLEGNNGSIFSGNIKFHYSNGKVQVFKNSPERYLRLCKRLGMGLYHPATFVPKLIYNEIGLYDEKYKLCADADFVIRCFKHNIKVVFIDKALSNMADGGASNQFSTKVLNDVKYKIKKHSESKLQYCYLYLKCYFDWSLHKIVPYKLVKIYRRIS